MKKQKGRLSNTKCEDRVKVLKRNLEVRIIKLQPLWCPWLSSWCSRSFFLQCQKKTHSKNYIFKVFWSICSFMYNNTL